jgi:hypothetical protein
LLALRAAASGNPLDAAATYAQQPIQKVLFDVHQFNGAMGMTTEHQLHFWSIDSGHCKANWVAATPAHSPSPIWRGAPPK